MNKSPKNLLYYKQKHIANKRNNDEDKRSKKQKKMYFIKIKNKFEHYKNWLEAA